MRCCHTSQPRAAVPQGSQPGAAVLHRMGMAGWHGRLAHDLPEASSKGDEVGLYREAEAQEQRFLSIRPFGATRGIGERLRV